MEIFVMPKQKHGLPFEKMPQGCIGAGATIDPIQHATTECLSSKKFHFDRGK